MEADWIRIGSDNRVVYWDGFAKGLGSHRFSRFKSREDADDFCDQLMIEAQRTVGMKVRRGTTWKDLCQHWTDAHDGRIPEGTMRRRLSAINAWIIPAVGAVEAKDTQLSTLIEVADRLVDADTGSSNFDSVIQTMQVIGTWAAARDGLPRSFFGTDEERRRALKPLRTIVKNSSRKVKEEGTEEGITIAVVPSWEDICSLADAVGDRAGGIAKSRTVGERYGPAGTTTAQLLGFTQPGSDLAFTDADGNLIAQANVKIAQSARVIREHFDRHPDVPIVYASSDAAQDAQRLGFQVILGGDVPESVDQVVIDIGRSSEAFDQEIAAGLGLGEWAADQASALDLLDAVPWFSTAAIAVRAIQRLRAGASRAEVLRESGRDVTVAAAGIASGKIAASATSSEPSIAVIALLASSLTYAATEVRRDWRGAGWSLAAAATLADYLTDLHSAQPSSPSHHRSR